MPGQLGRSWIISSFSVSSNVHVLRVILIHFGFMKLLLSASLALCVELGYAVDAFCLFFQMEYCQSVESGADCTKLVSLKGLDPSLYFREGNLNWGHPVARKLVLDSLCNWVEDFKVAT